MGGFEGADHVNGLQMALDMAAANGHVAQLDADYARAAGRGIRTLRETIGWRLAEPEPGRFDFGRARQAAESANRHGVQLLWTLMHYGAPADVDLLDDRAIERFARFAAAAAEAIGPYSEEAPIYNPVNEISFLAWAVSQTNMMHPYRNDPLHGEAGTTASGYEVKRRLVRMALAGIEAIRRVDPRARFLHVEPLVHVVPPRDRPELAELAGQISGYQWQAWDMLAGRAEPDLGGSPEALDLIGINHYHSSQWEAVTEQRLWWHLRDSRRQPFAALLRTAWERYRRPVIVAETSHFGEGRPQWLNEMASEVESARAAGVPVRGICLYPLVDRPDWSNLGQWHHSGLWDVEPGPPGAPLRRVLCDDYAASLAAWQRRLPGPAAPPGSATKPLLLVFSHLRWNFVYHRPQQLMTRLARRFHVCFVEEPLALKSDHAPARLDCIAHGPDIDVLLPRTALDDPRFSDAQLPVLQPLLEGFLREHGTREVAFWCYTPMAQPLIAALAASLDPGRVPARVVYDCIDEMSAFANAPPELAAREAALFGMADLVLASGPALQRAKRGAFDAVRCVPNGVDAAHFAPSAIDPGSAQAVEAAQRQGPKTGPRLGYCGVVDERIDVELIATLADAHPDWQIVMAGPVIKIEADRVPRRPNILWLGHQPYVRLPHLIASWDVCLLPFALNGITRFINPAKTLEYMAAEKPIVATPVPDVVELHAGTVRIAASPTAFLAACEEALREPAPLAVERAAAMRHMVRSASWDDRVDAILALLDDADLPRPTTRLAA